MANFPPIKISCVQVKCDPRKLHDLPVSVTVLDIQDLSQLPTPRIFIPIFLQVKDWSIWQYGATILSNMDQNFNS